MAFSSSMVTAITTLSSNEYPEEIRKLHLPYR